MTTTEARNRAPRQVLSVPAPSTLRAVERFVTSASSVDIDSQTRVLFLYCEPMRSATLSVRGTRVATYDMQKPAGARAVTLADGITKAEVRLALEAIPSLNDEEYCSEQRGVLRSMYRVLRRHQDLVK